MKYLIHYVKFEIRTALFYVNDLSSTVKLKLGHNFSLFIHNSKLRFFSFCLWLTFQVFPNSQKDFVIFEFCSSWTSHFFPIHEKDGKLGFMNISECCTPKFFTVH